MQSQSARKSPPVIILKLDDVSQQHGKILPCFQKMADILESRQLQAGFGLICAVTWPGAKFKEVLKIIDFLIQQKAVFMKPSEYAASRKQK